MSLRKNRIWGIGSGRGGVGKTFLTASLGTAIARTGHTVILVDANLSAPDLYAHVGVHAPEATLAEMLETQETPGDALMATREPGMRLLTCVRDEPGTYEVAPAVLSRMADSICALEADFILIDVGTGSTNAGLDFFNLADERVVVAGPDPASLQAAFGYVRNALYRSVRKRFGAYEEVEAAFLHIKRNSSVTKPATLADFHEHLRFVAPELAEKVAALADSYRPQMLMNMVASDRDQRRAEIIQSATRKFLNVELQLCGLIPYDAAVWKASQRFDPNDSSNPSGIAGPRIRQVALGLMASNEEGGRPGSKKPQTSKGTAPISGLNDNLEFMGRELHVQTEDSGVAGCRITTQVFWDGRVILSTKSDYPSALLDPEQCGRIVDLMRVQHYNVIHEIETRATGDRTTLTGSSS